MTIREQNPPATEAMDDRNEEPNNETAAAAAPSPATEAMDDRQGQQPKAVGKSSHIQPGAKPNTHRTTNQDRVTLCCEACMGAGCMAVCIASCCKCCE